jgi:hypothetical protein
VSRLEEAETNDRGLVYFRSVVIPSLTHLSPKKKKGRREEGRARKTRSQQNQKEFARNRKQQ